MILFCYTPDKYDGPAEKRLRQITTEGDYLLPTEVEINPADNTAYARALCGAWLCEDDLIVIEHDIVIHDVVLHEFNDCTQPWCVFPYSGPNGSLIAELGCARFTRALKNALPGLMELAAASTNGGPQFPAGDWHRLDIRLRVELEALGHNRHVHMPPVEHLHAY